MANQLYFGDNLHVLREHVRDESTDLNYLDPPFYSVPRACFLDVADGAHTFKKARGEQQALEQGSLFGAAEAADRKGKYRAGK